MGMDEAEMGPYTVDKQRGLPAEPYVRNVTRIPRLLVDALHVPISSRKRMAKSDRCDPMQRFESTRSLLKDGCVCFCPRSRIGFS